MKFQKGNRAAAAVWKICDYCGVKKNAMFYFHKRSGRYKELPGSDPKRYDNVCKLCRKPVNEGQSRDELKEVKAPRGRKKKRKKYKRPSRATGAKLGRPYKKGKISPAAHKMRRKSQSRVQSMLYLAESGCEECGERDPRILEYDHKEPDQKNKAISRLILDGYSWSSPTLQREIRKCRILCANCHRRHTIRQQSYYTDEGVQAHLKGLAQRFNFRL